MMWLNRVSKVVAVVPACLALASCNSVRTVNGVDVTSTSTDPCSRHPLPCILVGGVILGGGAIFLASQHHGRRSPSTGSTGPTAPASTLTSGASTTSSPDLAVPATPAPPTATSVTSSSSTTQF